MSTAKNQPREEKPKRKSGPSGAHKSPRRLLSASPEEWEGWLDEAQREAPNFNAWARKTLNRARAAGVAKRAKR